MVFNKDDSKGVYKERNPNKLGFMVGDFPIKQAKIWLEDCKINYDGWRWHKIWTDHWKAIAYDSMMIAEYSQPVVQEQPKEEEEVPITIGKNPLKAKKSD